MRLPRHHLLTHLSGRRQAVADLGLAAGQVRRFAHCQVDGVWVPVWGKALTGGDLFFLFGNVGLPCGGQLYAKRWTIAQCFQNLKAGALTWSSLTYAATQNGASSWPW